MNAQLGDFFLDLSPSNFKWEKFQKLRLVNVSFTNYTNSKDTSARLYTVKPAYNDQIRSQTNSTVRSRWPLRATATYEIIFMDRIKKKSTR